MINSREIKTSQKQTFLWIFLIITLILMLMPFMGMFNDLLTRFVKHFDIYQIIQKYVIPWEVRLVGAILLPLGFAPQVQGDYLLIGKGRPLLIEIAWNCIGWQSLLFFILTGLVGFSGERYTLFSKIKAWVIGFLGTFLVNLLRITIVVLVSYYIGQSAAIVVHDYGSLLAVVCWLFFFWWFAYAFVLEEKDK